ncbi:MAG: sensor histidine kinase [Lachnospiraceae bacterium]|nr:sensor histidine kinase [Lachnospiraceae bacterium]MDE6981351.1 sensor histidine kinase [Lachnospiraceae bacterium]
MGTLGNRKSLRWKMVRMMLYGWLLPLLILTLGMIFTVSFMVKKQIEKTIVVSSDKAMQICDMQFQEMVLSSKNASYNSTIRDSYVKFLRQGVSVRDKKAISNFLAQQYKYDARILCTMLFFLDDTEEVFYVYNTYQDNNTGNEAFRRKTFFIDNMQNEVIEKSKSLDTGIVLMEKEGHLYLVRNLVNSSFTPYAMLVMELKPEDMLESLNSIWGMEHYEMYIDGVPLIKNGVGERFHKELIIETTEGSVYYNDRKEAFVYKVTQWGQQRIAYVVELNSKSIIDETVVLWYTFTLALFFMLLLIAVVFRFVHTKVTKPMAELIEGAREIALGNYGHHVEIEKSSYEFEYLDRAFNTMSSELKYQFETIYEEELALKDANIKALQSQINPHFLNNTLEIINWEARMNGNDNVSGMIEALTTMLNATMNRKQRRFVMLSEELSYVDAYLYIISSRYGERFQVHRDIDESLLGVSVPILIIQPIVENAVEHGVEENRKGIVEIKIYREEDKLYIKVINDGILKESDKEKIRRLLGEGEAKLDESHISLGIRNVNRRLKIIYGDDCGLTVESDEENKTVSTILVKLPKEDNISQ